MKTREDIITSMCYMWDHSYGAPFQPWSEVFNCDEDQISEGASKGLGYTDEDRQILWNRMAQVFDNDIAPFMEFNKEIRKANRKAAKEERNLKYARVGAAAMIRGR